MNEGRSSMNTVYILYMSTILQYVNCECGSTRNYNSEMIIIAYNGNGWLYWWRQIGKTCNTQSKVEKRHWKNDVPFTARANFHCSYNNCKLPVITKYFFFCSSMSPFLQMHFMILCVRFTWLLGLCVSFVV